MLLVLRFIIMLVYVLLVCIIGLIFCIFSPKNKRYTSTFGQLFSKLSTIFGITVETRKLQFFNNAIYICNHQNNYDMIITSRILQPNMVTVGKKSLLWIPFFGLLYWLTGNILIDRKNSFKAHKTINELIKKITHEKNSLLIFPEGTRNYKQGLLPFKSGAFRIALILGLKIIPIVVSNTQNKIYPNRLNNGLVIIEMLPPIDFKLYSSFSAKQMANHCYNIMLIKLRELNQEVKKREKQNITMKY
ncbi:MAG: 1-acylglycerol-3-phosphate O-acyltransferase [Pantoea sp. Brub]|nr:1-acylglycerol-3-phosphate O-acyltransferase [Pantoea sp. Brub]